MRTAVLVSLSVLAIAPIGAADDLPPTIDRLLQGIRAADKGQLAVSEEDGRFLRILIASTGAKRVLEIGAASGYSAIWMGLGLRQTGGRLVTIEYDPVRAREAAANVKQAGLGDVVQVISGDAFKEIPKLQGTFDLVFLDPPRYAKSPFGVVDLVHDYAALFKPALLATEEGGSLICCNNVARVGREDWLDAGYPFETGPARG